MAAGCLNRKNDNSKKCFLFSIETKLHHKIGHFTIGSWAKWVDTSLKKCNIFYANLDSLEKGNTFLFKILILKTIEGQNIELIKKYDKN